MPKAPGNANGPDLRLVGESTEAVDADVTLTPEQRAGRAKGRRNSFIQAMRGLTNQIESDWERIRDFDVYK